MVVVEIVVVRMHVDCKIVVGMVMVGMVVVGKVVIRLIVQCPS